MDVLYVIPARGGSKGMPGKNIKPLNGKPLICYSIDVARKMAEDDDICVTTDDDEIIRVVTDYGLAVPFKRPGDLAADTSGMYEVLLHAVHYYQKTGRQYDCLVLLQPTSPFRMARHVEEALGLYDESIDLVLGVSETRANPYFSLHEENEDGFLQRSKSVGRIATRQAAPKVYDVNGAVYVVNIRSLKRTHMLDFVKLRKYVMDDLSSMDVDTALDWEFCAFLIEKGIVRVGA